MVTVHEMAKKMGNIPLWRIDYAIRCLGIKEIRRAGHIRLFDDSVIEKLQQAMNRKNAMGDNS